jgi:peptidoglycan/xylan/chitin deacetylase (PgdA/CDA1 family)
MKLSQVWSRIFGRYQRDVGCLLFRRAIKMRNRVAYVSFTFDDFPRAALHAGGEILIRLGLRATYYASFGLMGTNGPSGEIFVTDDIKQVIEQGHELGCHTFGHCHSLETTPRAFEDSVIRNSRALSEVVPGTVFKSFSYPISGPRLGTKRRVSRYFRCCRGGGQTFNTDTADLNLLKAFFLEKSRDNPGFVKEVIARNCRARGWLIFASHDISETPTPYGCTPSFLEDIIKYSVDSGARILPVSKALDAICGDIWGEQ